MVLKLVFKVALTSLQTDQIKTTWISGENNKPQPKHRKIISIIDTNIW